MVVTYDPDHRLSESNICVQMENLHVTRDISRMRLRPSVCGLIFIARCYA